MKIISNTVLLLSFLLSQTAIGQQYDLAINNGRILDPETGLDAIRHVGINGGDIVTLSEKVLAADSVIDAKGLVVAPGFIDLHTHSPTPLGQYYQAFDGVTTALELEVGSFPILDYGVGISDTPLINFGASAGHVGMRVFEKNGLNVSDILGGPKPEGIKGWMTALTYFFTDADTALAESLYEEATDEEIATMRELLNADLEAGALGIGLPLDYFSDAIQDAEMRMIFATAAQHDAPIFVHIRRGIDGDPSGLTEVIDLAREYGAAVHICHISHNAISNLEFFLGEVRKAQDEGIDITTEVLPYNAGSALISSAVFGRDWQTIFNITYADVEWAATGERFNKAMWDDYYENKPDGQVVHHYLREEWTQRAVVEPGVIIVSDLLTMVSRDKNVAPHNGAFSKVLGRYVREQQLLDLMTAVRKMTLLPARRLQDHAPAFRQKGRLQPGMDADITIFNPDTIVDNATYRNAYQEATGIEYLIVNGKAVIKEGKLVEGTYPGQRMLATGKR
ncbi:MAG: amidohydrolase family protein [Halieaceae bacterium]